jgi:hypothetical protein
VTISELKDEMAKVRSISEKDYEEIIYIIDMTFLSVLSDIG